jgi:membrane protein implicated in regulation of membrane protease activity
MIYIWLSIAVCFLLFEIGHPGLFFFLSFSCAAVCAAAVSFGAYDITVQIITFLTSAVCFFAIMRTFFARPNQGGLQTNVYALQGKQAVVTHPIPARGVGRIKVGGEEWSAQSVHDGAYPVGTRVTIIRVQGARLIVEPDHNNSSTSSDKKGVSL